MKNINNQSKGKKNHTHNHMRIIEKHFEKKPQKTKLYKTKWNNVGKLCVVFDYMMSLRGIIYSET
jgi:hypothetical protein